MQITDLGNGQYCVSDGAHQRLAYAVGPPHARWVFVEGRVYLIDASRSDVADAAGTAVRRQRGHADDMALAPPMPATVAAVHVVPGQDVAEGDLVAVLEAMKMELPIRAPRAGRVKLVRCRPGELVQPGVPLVELE